MNFYDVLAAKNWDGGVPTINFFDLLFAQSMGGGEQWQTYEGTLPATINANGDDMRQYQVYGATGGVGDRTENILDESILVKGFYYQIDGKIIIHPISVGSNIYRSFRQSLAPGTYTVSFGNAVFLARVIVDGVMSENVGENISSYTVTTQTGDIGFSMRRTTSSQTPWNNNPMMLTEGSTPPASFVPFGYEVDMVTSDGTTSTTTPIYIGDTALQKDEYIDYQAGKVYRRTAQVMPSVPAETKTSSGITVTCDGDGRYSISGTATANAYIIFDIPEFTIPISAGKGGNGTFSMFNTSSNPNASLQFLYNDATVDEWTFSSTNRTSTAYVTMGGRTVNGLKFYVPSGNAFVATVSPMFTDNGVLPETYTPYLQPTDPPVPLPALPTCEGETIIDYVGQSVAPEKVIFEYKKGGN